MTTSKLVTRKDVAERLGVSVRSVQNFVASNKLRERRIPSGRGVRSLPRYAVADIEAFIASGFSRGLR